MGMGWWIWDLIDSICRFPGYQNQDKYLWGLGGWGLGGGGAGGGWGGGGGMEKSAANKLPEGEES